MQPAELQRWHRRGTAHSRAAPGRAAPERRRGRPRAHRRAAVGDGSGAGGGAGARHTRAARAAPRGPGLCRARPGPRRRRRWCRAARHAAARQRLVSNALGGHHVGRPQRRAAPRRRRARARAHRAQVRLSLAQHGRSARRSPRQRRGHVLVLALWNCTTEQGLLSRKAPERRIVAQLHWAAVIVGIVRCRSAGDEKLRSCSHRRTRHGRAKQSEPTARQATATVLPAKLLFVREVTRNREDASADKR